MKLYCPVLAVLFVLAVGVATGTVIENQYPGTGSAIVKGGK